MSYLKLSILMAAWLLPIAVAALIARSQKRNPNRDWHAEDES
jgi:hypothetical protein